MNDARIAELEFLSRLERERIIMLSHRKATDPEVRIAMHLLAEGVVNDATTVPGVAQNAMMGHLDYPNTVQLKQWNAIAALHESQEVRIVATHAAAVRRAALEQSIQRGRLRDPTGILFDHRYAERDLQIALFSASAAEPLVIAFLDMNGLTYFNNMHGHDAGDDALRVFFEVVAGVVAERGEAYRVGGDEVVVLLPRTSLQAGASLIRMVVRGVSAREVRGMRVSVVAGVTVAANPNETAAAVRKRADAIQYKAKDFSRTDPSGRFGALAIDGEDAIERIDSAPV